MKEAFKMEHVTKRYPGFVLDDVSLALPSGCIMGLIGENGAGKSTLIRVLLGLAHSDGGTAEVLGCRDINRNKEIKEHIGVVPDTCLLPGELTLKECSSVMSKIYRTWDTDKFRMYTEMFSLPMNRKAKDFSRGMRMALSISAAMSHDSRLLLLDEATSGLDPMTRDSFLGFLLDFIQDETHSVLISSHIVSDLEKVCDYIAFLHQGRIQFCEEKDALLERYAVVRCSEQELARLDRRMIYGQKSHAFGTEALVDRRAAEGFVCDQASIEDIMIFMGKERKE